VGGGWQLLTALAGERADGFASTRLREWWHLLKWNAEKRSNDKILENG
jgi:hypothetical protein